MRKITLIILISGIIISALCSCAKKTDEQLITEKISEFSQAYCSGDMDAAIDCFCAKDRNKIKSEMNILGNIGSAVLGAFKINYKMDMSDLFGYSVGILSNENILKININSIDIASDGKEATVSVNFVYSTLFGDQSKSDTIKMVKEGRDWFIAE